MCIVSNRSYEPILRVRAVRHVTHSTFCHVRVCHCLKRKGTLMKYKMKGINESNIIN
jgi:hypothetical protein